MQKGKRCRVQAPETSAGFGKGWWSFELQTVRRAIVATTALTLACLGTQVWESSGISIGGIMSSSVVAVVLGSEELSWLEKRAEHGDLGFHFDMSMPVEFYLDWVRICS